MTRPPVANTVKVENFWTGPDAVSAANIYYALVSAPINEANLTAIAEGMSAAVQNYLLPLVAVNWFYAGCTCSDNSGGELFNNQPADVHGGNSAGDAMPPNTAVVCGWSITARYRGGHPRTYQPGIAVTDADVNSGRLLSSAKMTAWQTGFANFLNNFNTIPLSGGGAPSLGTIAYFRHNAPLVPPVFYPYQSAEVRPRFGTQRRRMGKPPLL